MTVSQNSGWCVVVCCYELVELFWFGIGLLSVLFPSISLGPTCDSLRIERDSVRWAGRLRTHKSQVMEEALSKENVCQKIQRRFFATTKPRGFVVVFFCSVVCWCFFLEKTTRCFVQELSKKGPLPFSLTFEFFRFELSIWWIWLSLSVYQHRKKSMWRQSRTLVKPTTVTTAVVDSQWLSAKRADGMRDFSWRIRRFLKILQRWQCWRGADVTKNILKKQLVNKKAEKKTMH